MDIRQLQNFEIVGLLCNRKDAGIFSIGNFTFSVIEMRNCVDVRLGQPNITRKISVSAGSDRNQQNCRDDNSIVPFLE